MFNKKLINIFILASIFFILLTGTIDAKDANFVSSGSAWAKEALEFANKNKLLEGIPGDINPKKDLTRAEMASIMNNIFNSHEKSDISRYEDMKRNTWYYDDMAKAVHMGMFKGFNNKLNPEKSISREEAFAVISRSFKVKELHGSQKIKGFSDLNEISDWARDDIYALVNSGYLKGSNGKINPLGNITVEEFLQLLDNMIGQIISKPGLYDNVDKGNIVINKPAVIIKNQTIGGDVIIAEGVANEDVILENVVVRGNVIVRGGELILRSNTLVSNIYIDRIDGDFRLKVEKPSIAKKVVVNSTSEIDGDGNILNLVILSGKNTKILMPNVNVVNQNKRNSVYDKRKKEIPRGHSFVNEQK